MGLRRKHRAHRDSTDQDRAEMDERLASVMPVSLLVEERPAEVDAGEAVTEALGEIQALLDDADADAEETVEITQGSIVSMSAVNGVELEHPFRLTVVDQRGMTISAWVIGAEDEQRRAEDWVRSGMLSAVVFGAPTGAVLASVVVTEVRPMAGRWLVSFRPPRTWVEIDQREQPRIAVDLPATVHWNDRSFEGRCSDLSAGGCRLVLPGVSGIARGYQIDIDLDSDERSHRVVGSVVAAHLAHDQVADVLHVKFADPVETGPYETAGISEIDEIATNAVIDEEPAAGEG